MQSKHIITRNYYQNKNDLKNPILQDLKQRQFRYGNGNYDQFVKDFVRRNFRFYGVQHLGLTLECIEKLDSEKLLQTEVTNVVNNITNGKADVFFNVHSQEPTYLINRILLTACLNDQFIVAQTDDYVCSLEEEDKNGNCYLFTYLPYIKIKMLDGGEDILIPGPIVAKFKVIDSNIKAPYYLFESIETDNDHIAKILQEQPVSAEEIVKYYGAQNSKAVIAQCNHLIKQLQISKEEQLEIEAKLKVEQAARATDLDEIRRNKQIQQKLLEQQVSQSTYIADLTQDLNNEKRRASKIITDLKHEQQKNIELTITSNENAAKAQAALTRANNAEAQAAIANNRAKQAEAQAAAANKRAEQAEELSYHHIRELPKNNQVPSVVRDIADAVSNAVNPQDITNAINALQTYQMYLLKHVRHEHRNGPIPALAAQITNNLDDHQNMDHGSRVALRKYHSCEVLRNILLSNDLSAEKRNKDTPMEKAMRFGLELKRGDHLKILKLSRTSTLGYFIKVLLAPFTCFASLRTYLSDQGNQASKTVNTLFKPVKPIVELQYEQEQKRQQMTGG